MAASFDKFTERARKVLTLAHEEALRFNHNYVGTEHLLLGLVREGDGVAAKVLANMGVDLNTVRSAVEFIIGRGDREVTGEIELTPRAKKVIELARDEARRLNHHYIATEHLLLGLVREGEGIAAGVLASVGVSLDKVRAHVIHVLSHGSPPSAPLRDLNEVIQIVDRIGIDPARAVDAGYPIWDFTWWKEVDRLVEVLGRSSRNNPLLVGDIGSFKALIIQELARRLRSGEPPPSGQSQRLIIIDVGSLVTGAMLKSLHERRLRAVVDEIRQAEGKVLPVFEDIHLLLGAGVGRKWEEGSPLRMALINAKLQCVGSTTRGGYRALVEGDAALAEHFEPVEVPQPTIQDIVKNLWRVKGPYERHHGLEITDEAVNAAAEEAALHVSDGDLPELAIDLIDGAATRVRQQVSSEAISLKEARRSLQEALAALQIEKESALVSRRYELAAEARDREVKLRERIDRLERPEADQPESNRPTLTREHIAEVVSNLTGGSEPPPTGDA